MYTFHSTNLELIDFILHAAIVKIETIQSKSDQVVFDIIRPDWNNAKVEKGFFYDSLKVYPIQSRVFFHKISSFKLDSSKNIHDDFSIHSLEIKYPELIIECLDITMEFCLSEGFSISIKNIDYYKKPEKPFLNIMNGTLDAFKEWSATYGK